MNPICFGMVHPNFSPLLLNNFHDSLVKLFIVSKVSFTNVPDQIDFTILHQFLTTMDNFYHEFYVLLQELPYSIIFLGISTFVNKGRIYEVEVQLFNGIGDLWINKWKNISLRDVSFGTGFTCLVTPIITKLRIPMIINSNGIILWTYHSLVQDIVGLCQYL